MGDGQFGFMVSTLGVSVKPGALFALGAMLVVVFMIAMTAIYLSCYYWAPLARMTISPLPSPSSPNGIVHAPTCKILRNLAPSTDTPRSTVVMMPGNDIPTFLAMPCQSCPTLEKKVDATSRQPTGLQNNVVVKLEV